MHAADEWGLAISRSRLHVFGMSSTMMCVAVQYRQDMEVEIDRFEGSKGAMIKKYQYVSRPDPKPRELAIVAVDALATLAIGESCSTKSTDCMHHLQVPQ